MRQTAPPALAFPTPEDSVEAEVIVCRGPPKCDGQVEVPCPFCIRVGAGADVDEILAEISRTH